jgi:hypothetical protein
MFGCNAYRLPSSSVRGAVVGPSMVGSARVGPAIVMEIMVTVKTMGQEDRTADKQQRPIEPRVPPVVRLGVGIQIDRLWWQRVDLLRQSRCIQRDLPAPIWLLARLADGLSRLPFNRDLRGELAAILKAHPRWDERSVRRTRGNRPDTARQDKHRCNTQKGMRTSISRIEAGARAFSLKRESGGIPKSREE